MNLNIIKLFHESCSYSSTCSRKPTVIFFDIFFLSGEFRHTRIYTCRYRCLQKNEAEPLKLLYLNSEKWWFGRPSIYIMSFGWEIVGSQFQRQTPWTSGVSLAFIMFFFHHFEGTNFSHVNERNWNLLVCKLHTFDESTLPKIHRVFFCLKQNCRATSISHVFLPNKNSPISNGHFLRTTQKIDRSQHIHQQTSCHTSINTAIFRSLPTCLCSIQKDAITIDSSTNIRFLLKPCNSLDSESCKGGEPNQLHWLQQQKWFPTTKIAGCVLLHDFFSGDGTTTKTNHKWRKTPSSVGGHQHLAGTGR